MMQEQWILYKEIADREEGDYSFISDTPLTEYEFVGLTDNEDAPAGHTVISFDKKYFDKEDLVCKCEFFYENRLTRIVDHYIVDYGDCEESYLHDAKLWFLTHID